MSTTVTITVETKLKKIADALTAIEGLKVYHYYRSVKQLPYCIWEEVTEADAFEGNNHKGEQAIQGAVHYFTRKEFDPMVDKIQEALTGAENVYWRYESIQFEEESNTIHHEWLFDVM